LKSSQRGLSIHASWFSNRSWATSYRFVTWYRVLEFTFLIKIPKFLHSVSIIKHFFTYSHIRFKLIIGPVTNIGSVTFLHCSDWILIHSASLFLNWFSRFKLSLNHNIYSNYSLILVLVLSTLVLGLILSFYANSLVLAQSF
jgi:hypothetical protein